MGGTAASAEATMEIVFALTLLMMAILLIAVVSLWPLTKPS